jgi:uncharacterized membrane protein YoaT (DUF817 family)
MLNNEISPFGKLLLAILALACAVALIALFYENNALLSALLTGASGVVILRSRHRLTDLIPFVVGALIGPAMEIIVIRFGAWTYTHPSVAGVPAWLPLLWGLTAFFLVKISRLLQDVARKGTQ